MASQEYHRGEMDIHAQKATWDGFMVGSVWGSLIIIMTLGYAALAIAIGLHWVVALGLMAILGFGAGIFMNLGGRWMATVVVMIVLALIVQGFIWLFNVFL
ncbi:aa3-type cytochrome c oxidase subunit IV [Hyphomonas sp. WL0036]|uniref:aa3-type cytochrome c oxidase subunit IV n=1 Tax=Hyphomonas sediminis TaxID=2866160 RepID=UPI001C7EA4BE|nr:aa3-type cytochrome c oxidase subunit IV [Hyphomonas sediminis]MBY9066396.1 aa3-type cytochrome c oxidase subunit IV [Hyphomonas sediminis]